VGVGSKEKLYGTSSVTGFNVETGIGETLGSGVGLSMLKYEKLKAVMVGSALGSKISVDGSSKEKEKDSD
jgi:hypothetical protein